jgi:hypothetical protein
MEDFWRLISRGTCGEGTGCGRHTRKVRRDAQRSGGPQLYMIRLHVLSGSLGSLVSHTIACRRPSSRTARSDMDMAHDSVVVLRDALPQKFELAQLKVPTSASSAFLELRLVHYHAVHCSHLIASYRTRDGVLYRANRSWAGYSGHRHAIPAHIAAIRNRTRLVMTYLESST